MRVGDQVEYVSVRGEVLAAFVASMHHQDEGKPLHLNLTVLLDDGQTTNKIKVLYAEGEVIPPVPYCRERK